MLVPDFDWRCDVSSFSSFAYSMPGKLLNVSLLSMFKSFAS